MSWTKAVNKEPAMVIAGIMCVVAIAMPYTIIPIRRSLGYPTHQWDNDPATHPVRSAHVLAAWHHYLVLLPVLFLRHTFTSITSDLPPISPSPSPHPFPPQKSATQFPR